MRISGLSKFVDNYIEYLHDKTKIVDILDTNKRIKIKSYSIITYVLIVISLLAPFGLTEFLKLTLTDKDGYGLNITSKIIVAVGVILFFIILVGVTWYEWKNSHFNAIFINNSEFKVNGVKYNIENKECFIKLMCKRHRGYEYNVFTGRTDYNRIYERTEYYIQLMKNKKKQTLLINNKKFKEYAEFLENFEYEILN